MKYEVTINNYQKGAQLKTAMPDHVILLEKIDRNHHRVVYELENDRQEAPPPRLRGWVPTTSPFRRRRMR